MEQIIDIIQNYTDEQQTIQTIIYLAIISIQTIINLFVIIDYIKSKSNTKLLIATTLILLLVVEILNIVL